MGLIRYIMRKAAKGYHSLNPVYQFRKARKDMLEGRMDRYGHLEKYISRNIKDDKFKANQLKIIEDEKKKDLTKIIRYSLETAAIIFLLIAAAIFISNSNSPTGYAIFSSNILTLDLSPILGLFSLIVALILLMNKK